MRSLRIYRHNGKKFLIGVRAVGKYSIKFPDDCDKNIISFPDELETEIRRTEPKVSAEVKRVRQQLADFVKGLLDDGEYRTYAEWVVLYEKAGGCNTTKVFSALSCFRYGKDEHCLVGVGHFSECWYNNVYLSKYEEQSIRSNSGCTRCHNR